MKTDWITFGLAITGYALLAIDLLWHARGRRHRGWSTLTAVVVVAHVTCVWLFRLHLDPVAAFEKSPLALVVFHAALGMIVAAPLLDPRWWSRALVGAFVLVTIGAISATFLYEEVAVLRIPVLAIALLKGGRALLVWRRLHHWIHPRSTS